MDVKAQSIRDLRQTRGWTQQHLADASGISLRTVQRVEKLGVASPETLLGLCAVLEVDHSTLLASNKEGTRDWKQVLIPAAIALAFALGVLLGRGLG